MTCHARAAVCFCRKPVVIALHSAGMSRTPSPTRRWPVFSAIVGGGVRTPLIRTHSDVLVSAGCFGSLHCVLLWVVVLCHDGFLLIKIDTVQGFRDVIQDSDITVDNTDLLSGVSGFLFCPGSDLDSLDEGVEDFSGQLRNLRVFLCIRSETCCVGDLSLSFFELFMVFLQLLFQFSLFLYSRNLLPYRKA